MSTRLISIGKVVGVFGLKGALKIWPNPDYIDYFQPENEVIVNEQSLTISEVGWHKKQARIWMEGVNKVEQAEQYIGFELYVPKEKLSLSDEDEYYVEDLIGINIVDERGNSLGQLEEVMHMPAHDVYKSGDLMIPAVKEFVKKVDLKNRRMTVKIIEGMIEK